MVPTTGIDIEWKSKPQIRVTASYVWRIRADSLFRVNVAGGVDWLTFFEGSI